MSLPRLLVPLARHGQRHRGGLAAFSVLHREAFSSSASAKTKTLFEKNVALQSLGGTLKVKSDVNVKGEFQGVIDCTASEVNP